MEENRTRKLVKSMSSLDIRHFVVKPLMKDTEIYCWCKRPYVANRDIFMIQCDVCDAWYHDGCLGLDLDDAEKLRQSSTQWICPTCLADTKFAAIKSLVAKYGHV